MGIKLRKGIYLPSIFTSLNLGCGYLSIIAALNGRFSVAAWIIVLGWVFDIADGRLARFSKTASSFGVEFDSLADMITFGISPAVLLWVYYFKDYPNYKLGVAVCFVHVLAVAIRLAKYNVKATTSTKPPFFEGLPTPAAAGVYSAFVLLMEISRDETPKRAIKFLVDKAPFFAHILPFVIIIVSALMLTRLRYPTGGKFKLTGMIPLRIFIIIITWIALLILYPESIISLQLIAYVLYGMVDLVIRTMKMGRGAPILPAGGQDDKQI